MDIYDKENEYKYEVSFSFLAEDEMIAYKINDLIQDRVKTFIYSEKQAELGSSDGLENFSQVFGSESRIDVVLYRNGWGQSRWTRVECDAIKNRAFNKGWKFLLIVNLDKNSKLPGWIPETYLWVDYEKYGAIGVASVIEFKIKENGGTSSEESISDRALRLNRKMALTKSRKMYLASSEVLTDANKEVALIFNKLREIKDEICNPNLGLTFNVQEERSNYYMIGHKGLWLTFQISSLDYQRMG